MTAQVLAFPVREPDTFLDAWSCRAGQMRKRGDGQDKTRKLWAKHAAKVGQARLLEALKRYLREEKEPTCGYPGLSVWLNGERYDHWLPTGAEQAKASNTPRAPEPLRQALLGSLGEPFVISYLDPSTFHPDGWITPATGYAKGKLMEKGRELKACGLQGIRNKDYIKPVD